MKKVFLALFLGFFLGPACSQSQIQFLEDEAEENVNISFSLKPAAAGAFSVVFDYGDKNNFYALDCTPGAVTLRSVIAGTPHRLATTPLNWKSPSEVLIKRRSWLMEVVVDKTVVLTAYDITLNSGQIGSTANGGWSWSGARVQPVEAELYFNDDFTREPGKTGEWKNATGTWKLTSSSENINQSNQAMSANPFSYQAQAATTPSFSHAGRAFWDSYNAQVSVRPESQGTVGLAFYVQDPKNYLAFLWSAEEGSNARQLVKVENGQARVLASAAGAFLPRQWYKVGIRTSPNFVETFLDGAPVFRIRNSSFGQGGIGLFAAKTAANFDDVRVRSYPYFRQDFNGPTGGAWTPAGGFWRAADGVLNSASKPGDGGATRMLLAGSDDWADYEMTASGKAGEAGSCGLVVGYKDDKNYTVFRWAANASTLPFKGRAQMLRYKNGSAIILSDGPAPAADDDGFLRVKLRFKSGAISALVRDEIVAQAADESLQNGRVGLWVQGPQVVSFRDVVMFLPPEPDAPKIAAKMEGDALMVGWASAAGEWPPRLVGKELEFWNTGEFFGDAQIEYVWRPKIVGANAVEWALRADSNNFAAGYILRAEGQNTLKLTLTRGGQVLRAAEVDLKTLGATDADPATLKIQLEGKAILVSVGGKPALSFLPVDATAAPAGTRIAARSVSIAGKFILAARDLRATSANRDDYTFNEAPTDWYSPSGNWSIFSRWPCYSDWSFFGGQGHNPVLWSKREYSGDTVVEMYVHPQMNLPKELGYSHPGDLNVTLFGDGKTTASGYSFVLAGWSNTRSAILKNSVVVAQNTSEKAIFDRPTNRNTSFHRRWYYVRAEARRAEQDGKRGVRLRFYVDEQLLGEYFDATPLDTFARGRVAFWTVDGAMMIARAKIESELPGGNSLPANLPDAGRSTLASSASGDELTVSPVVIDGGNSALVESVEGATRVTNPTGGGQFAVQLQRPGGDSSWRIEKAASFDADMAFSPQTKVDLYVTIDGRRHLIELTGEQRPDASARRLGAATMAAKSSEGGQSWRQVTFALGAALHKLYPKRDSWTVEKLEIGAMHGDEYRWQGFFGNPLGSSYYLKHARLQTS